MTGFDLVARLRAEGGALALTETGVVATGVDDAGRADLARHRQDVIVALLEEQGIFHGKSARQELLILKALQIVVREDVERARDTAGEDGAVAVREAEQALADVQRLARAFNRLADPAFGDDPEFGATLKWAGHAALRLAHAATALHDALGGDGRQAALL